MAAPSLYHWLPVPEFETNTTPPPEQKVVGPRALMAGVGGSVLTVTTTGALSEEPQPVGSVKITV
jgi:hypothetical protein